MTILIIAEKPGMGKDIAAALGVMLSAPVTGGGLVQYVGNYAITAAVGHLFELQEPEAYGAQFQFPWRVDVLPVFPVEFLWELKRKKVPGKRTGEVDSGVKARFDEIKNQLRKADSVIHAGDPGREGQLIVDIILREAGWKGKTQRLWLHAQTEGGIIEAFGKIKSNQDWANLLIAAECRAEADWAIGMNGTRAYSAIWWEKGHKGVVNVGRVVTPVVGMIVTRENQIKNFVPTDHYSLMANIKINGKDDFKAAWVRPANTPGLDPTGKMLIEKKVATEIAGRLNKKPAVIAEATKKPKQEAPPLLLCLMDLQKLGAKLGYSPAQVLEGAQELYDKHKLTSYPRTDCQYAPESEFLKAKNVLNTIKSNFGSNWSFKHDVVVTRKSKSFNDAKLEEHYAILPLATRCDIGSLKKREADLYYLIVRQYLAQFCSDFESLATVILVKVEGETFKATGSIPTKDGWRALFGGAESASRNTDDDSVQENLPNVSTGETGIADPVTVSIKKTRSPVRYTSITLLDAMKNAWQLVTDPEIKKRLKEIEGLGTSATRANVIEKIVASNFVTEEKKKNVASYAPTQKAYAMVASVPALITEPDLTAYFEGKLDGVGKGEIGQEEFKGMLYKMVNMVIGPAKDPAKRAAIIAAMPKPSDIVAAPAAKSKTSSKRKAATA